MSLEMKIEKLTAAVVALTDRMDALQQRDIGTCVPEQAAPAEKPKAEKPKAEKPKAEKPKAEKPKAEKQEADTPTAQDLMEMCLNIVKSDRSLKDKIKDIIAGYGGKTIAEVDASKYNDLKSDLEALQ